MSRVASHRLFLCELFPPKAQGTGNEGSAVFGHPRARAKNVAKIVSKKVKQQSIWGVTGLGEGSLSNLGLKYYLHTYILLSVLTAAVS